MIQLHPKQATNVELHCFNIPCITRPGGGANKESATVSFLQLSHRYSTKRQERLNLMHWLLKNQAIIINARGCKTLFCSQSYFAANLSFQTLKLPHYLQNQSQGVHATIWAFKMSFYQGNKSLAAECLQSISSSWTCFIVLWRRGKIWMFYVGKANGEQRIRNSECEQNNE